VGSDRDAREDTPKGAWAASPRDPPNRGGKEMWSREPPYLKGVAIFAVIAIHTTDWYQSITPGTPIGVGGNLVDTFDQFAVPLFVFVSGLVLATNYAGSFPKKAFYKKRIAAILPAYLIFSTLYRRRTGMKK
jgi:hypothetical protein